MALLLAVYERYFGRLAAELREAVEAHEHPADQLRAACLRYLRFAVDHAEAYHVMFTVPINDGRLPRPIADAERPGAEALAVMAGVLPDAGSTPADLFPATLCLWAGLHGLATLRQPPPGRVATRGDSGGHADRQLHQRIAGRRLSLSSVAGCPGSTPSGTRIS